MTEQERKRLVELLAEAIWQAESIRVHERPRRAEWAEVGEETWRVYRPLAHAAIAAAERAGFEWRRRDG